MQEGETVNSPANPQRVEHEVEFSRISTEVICVLLL